MVATFQTYVKGVLAKVQRGQALLNILRTLKKRFLLLPSQEQLCLAMPAAYEAKGDIK